MRFSRRCTPWHRVGAVVQPFSQQSILNRINASITTQLTYVAVFAHWLFDHDQFGESNNQCAVTLASFLHDTYKIIGLILPTNTRWILKMNNVMTQM